MNHVFALPSKVRVMLVADRTVVRSGLAALLHAFDDFEVVGEAANGEEALRLCARMQPDVVLMVSDMSGVDGPTASRTIQEKFPNIQILVLTSVEEDVPDQDTHTAGTIGYLLKNVTPHEMANAIRSAYRNRRRTTLAQKEAEGFERTATHRDIPTIGKDLTDREREVLELMVEGLDNNKIAETLVVSRSTVKFHVSNILSKLFASSRTEAVVIALHHHLVPR